MLLGSFLSTKPEVARSLARSRLALVFVETMLAFVACFAVAVVHRGIRDAECATNAQCFGGTCKIATFNGHNNGNGSCTCPPSWTGPRCQLLRLQPALPTAPGLVLRHANTSTWGGGAVQAAVDAVELKGVESWAATL